MQTQYMRSASASHSLIVMYGMSADWLEMVEDISLLLMLILFCVFKTSNTLFNLLTVTELNISSTYEGSSNATRAGKVQGLYATCHLVFVQKMALQACSKNLRVRIICHLVFYNQNSWAQIRLK